MWPDGRTREIWTHGTREVNFVSDRVYESDGWDRNALALIRRRHSARFGLLLLVDALLMVLKSLWTCFRRRDWALDPISVRAASHQKGSKVPAKSNVRKPQTVGSLSKNKMLFAKYYHKPLEKGPDGVLSI